MYSRAVKSMPKAAASTLTPNYKAIWANQKAEGSHFQKRHRNDSKSTNKNKQTKKKQQQKTALINCYAFTGCHEHAKATGGAISSKNTRQS